MLELHTRTADITQSKTVRGQLTRLELELRQMADSLAARLARDERIRADDLIDAPNDSPQPAPSADEPDTEA